MLLKITTRLWLFFSLNLIVGIAFAQERTVSGRLVNEKDQTPISAATITVKGTTRSVTSNSDGTFSITVPKAKSVLVITSIGFGAKEVIAGDGNYLSIALEEANADLDQVIVTGYSGQKKKDITGSVDVVNVKQFKEVPGGTPEALLQGRAAGVNVISSGVPGGASLLRIRGITSFGGADPLIIIDGTRGDLHDLNPYDIESISVLKDAGAAAIYGASGSSGVILVTTKKGKPGKTKYTYDFYYGTQRPLTGNVFNLLNTTEMATAQWNAFLNSGQTPSSPQYGSGPTPVIPDYIMIGNQYGLSREPTQSELDAYNIDWTKGPINQIIKANKTGTDWFHEIFRPAPIQSHTLTASGGSNKSAYLFSFNYFNQQGTLINTYLKRYSTRINTSFANADKSIRVGENAYIYYKQNPGFNNNAEGNAVNLAYRTQPIIPLYDVFGGYAGNKAPGVGDAENPVADLERGKFGHGDAWGIQGNLFAEADFLKHFTVRTQFGGSMHYNYNWGLGVRSYENSFSGPTNAYTEGSGFDRQWVWTNTLSYSNTFLKKNNIKVLVGTESISNNGRSLTATKLNYFLDDPNYANLATGSPDGQTSSSGSYASTIASYIGQLDYSYDERYLLGVRVRRDGASVFGTDNRYGVFPSLSAGWRISNEKFMRAVTWVNELKLRGSWGKIGSLSNTPSDNQFDLFGGSPGDAYYDISGTTTSPVQGFRQTRIGNPYTGWESDMSTNVGIDAAILNSKLDFTVEWYQKKISGLLFTDQSHYYGVGIAALPLVNIGDIENTGVDASLTYHGTTGNSDFRYDVGLTFTKYKSEVVNIPGVADYFTAGGTRIGNSDVARNQEGHPIGAFYGYQIVGLFQDASDVSKSPTQSQAAPGRFKYLDANNDGTINDDDRVFIGNPNPDFTYGLNLSAAYKNFDFSMFLYGSQGNDVFNYVSYWTDFYSSFAGVKSKNLLYNSWTPQNPNAKTPINETLSTFSTNGVVNSYYIENGSYLRCKSLMIGYTISPGLLSKIKVSSFRVYLQAANLFTITKYTGADPELSGGNTAFGIDYGNYPNNQKNYNVGVNLSF